MQIYYIEVRPENVPILWSYCRDSDCFAPDSELWLLRLDLLIAFRRYGARNRRAIATYLLPGREDWGGVL